MIVNDCSIDIKGLGQVVKLARLRLGLTQAALADKVGVTPARISELETESEGRNSTSLSLVQKIVSALCEEASKD